MKKIGLLVLGGFLITIPFQVMAGQNTYTDPYGGGEYKAGDCIMVNDPSLGDSTHVYTLNPDNTSSLNSKYRFWWARNARCEELQFHVDHNTTQQRLEAWLGQVVRERYSNIGASSWNGQTISTVNHEWFLIKDGKRYRVPDILTAMSWGLMIDDRVTVPWNNEYNTLFYNSVEDGGLLNYNDGPYHDYIQDVWSNMNFSQPKLPSRMQELLSQTYFQQMFQYTNYCSIYSRGAYCKTLDFGWGAMNGETYSS